MIQSGETVPVPVLRRVVSDCCARGEFDVVMNRYLPVVLRQGAVEEVGFIHDEVLTALGRLGDRALITRYLAAIRESAPGRRSRHHQAVILGACATDDPRYVFDLFKDVLRSDGPLSDAVASDVVHMLSRHLMIDEMRTVIAWFIEEHGRLSQVRASSSLALFNVSIF
jgi:hypothetical protein